MAEVHGERRWPMSLTVLVVIVLITMLPERMSSLPRWVLPGVLTILLIALVATDPGKITKTERELRWLSIALVVVLAATALDATTLLIHDLIEGSSVTNNPTTLLTTGGAVWLITIAAFALLYWEFDSGGPAVRAHGMPPLPRLRLPAAARPRGRAARLASGIRRLPVPGHHGRVGLQPHRRDAARSMDEAHDGARSHDLLGHHRSGHRSRRQHPQVIERRPRYMDRAPTPTARDRAPVGAGTSPA